MEFDLGQDEQVFCDTTRRFLTATMPLTALRAMADSESGFDRAWWRRGAELGWTSLLVAEEHGGAGLGPDGLRFLALLAEEMGRLVSPGPLVATNVVAATISRSGTSEHKAELLPSILSGESIAAWCLAEGGRKWSAESVQMRATATADGFVLSGVKTPVETGDDADLFLVTSLTADGLSQFLVPSSTPGITVQPLAGLDISRRFARVVFDNVSVPSSAMVGGPGDAADDVERQLQIALALQCAESAGAADRVLEFTIEYANDRYSFGRPLSSYQELKHRFADMKLWSETAQATSDAAVRAVAAEAANAGELVRVAKAYLGDHLPELVQDCIQIHGGIGVTWEHDIHLYLRRVATNRFMYGDPSEHRDTLAGLLLSQV